MGYFQANLSPAESALFVGMTFAATLLGRPLGAILFGSLADRLSLQRIGAITIYGFGTVTLLMACAADGVYEMMLTAKPLNVLGGVGSPPNALAIK